MMKASGSECEIRVKCRDKCSNSTVQLKGWGGETIQCVNQMTCKQASKHINNKLSANCSCDRILIMNIIDFLIKCKSETM